MKGDPSSWFPRRVYLPPHTSRSLTGEFPGVEQYWLSCLTDLDHKTEAGEYRPEQTARHHDNYLPSPEYLYLIEIPGQLWFSGWVGGGMCGLPIMI